MSPGARRWGKRSWWLTLAAVLLLWPPIFSDLNLGRWQLIPTEATMAGMGAFVIMALGLNIVVGYCGLLDLGYVAFYAAGAYVAGWFASEQFANHHIFVGAIGLDPHYASGIHVSPWILFFVAAIFASILGVLIGVPTLRLRGDYLAIVTLGFGEIIPQFVRNGDHLFGSNYNLTGGANGLNALDSIGFGTTIVNYKLLGYHPFHWLPDQFQLQTDPDRWFYWTVLMFIAFTLFCSLRLRDSRLGRAWIAIREDEIAAAAMGIPLMRTKTLAYAIGAFFGGIAGCYVALRQGSASPDNFYLQISIEVLCMVVLGGMGNVWGVCLGGAFLSYLDLQGLAAIGNETNRITHGVNKLIGHNWLSSNIQVPKYEFLIFGIIIVATMLFRPQGLIPSARRKAELELGVDGGSLYDASSAGS